MHWSTRSSDRDGLRVDESTVLRHFCASTCSVCNAHIHSIVTSFGVLYAGTVLTVFLHLHSLVCSGDGKGIRPEKAGCWHDGGDDLTGALHVL